MNWIMLFQTNLKDLYLKHKLATGIGGCVLTAKNLTTAFEAVKI